MIDKAIIPSIEKALGLKLWENQISYLTGQTGLVGGRVSGRTLAHMINLALTKGVTIDLTHPAQWCDERFDTLSALRQYSKTYRRDFMQVRDKLKQAGFEVCEVRNEPK